MLAAERENDALLGRRRLQLEIEALAELLAQRESPGAVDAAAEGRVQHELHATRFVEEALECELIHRGHDTEAPLCLRQVAGNLLSGRLRKAVVAHEQLDRCLELVVLVRLVWARQREIDRRS